MVAIAVVAAIGCGNAPENAAATETGTSAIVDSVVPMDVAMERFRADVARVDSLRSDVRSRDSLVARLVAALEANDTAAFEPLAMDRAEFAWLVYPYDPQFEPPYELPPGIAWMQLQAANRKGALRALRELGGRELDYRGYSCDGEKTDAGGNRFWTGCRVTIAPARQEPVAIRLFGNVVERGGRFEFVTLANDF